MDREGKPRTAYSLRHTYICLRLMEGADIYQIAKNCRTSVEMIEKYYAAHIKTTLDAAAINVRKGTISREPKRQAASQPRKRVLVRVSDEEVHPNRPGGSLTGARKKRATLELS